MRTTTAIIAPRNEFIVIGFDSQIRGTSPLEASSITGGGITPVATTSSTSFEEAFIAKYTIDTNGIITVNSIVVNLVTVSSPNGVIRIDISGDAGNTFVDMTGDVIGAKTLAAISGLWIIKIDTVIDGLQLKFLVRSTDGNPANIILDNAGNMAFSLNKNFAT